MLEKLKIKAREAIRQEVKQALKESHLTKQIERKVEAVVQDSQHENSQALSLQAEKLNRIEQKLEEIECVNADRLENINEKLTSLDKQSEALLAAIKKAEETRNENAEVVTTRQINSMKRAIAANAPDDALIAAKRILAAKAKSNRIYIDAANKMRGMLINSEKRESYTDSLKCLFDIHDINECATEQFYDVNDMRFPVLQAQSLTQQYVRRRRLKQLGHVPDRFLTYSKESGEEFAKMVGQPCVESEYGLTFDEIPQRNDTVIKPIYGGHSAIGVFLIYSPDNIWSVSEKIALHSWKELRQSIQEKLKTGLIKKDCFEIQPCLYADSALKLPAHDLKFYTFYGKVGSVLEVARSPEFAYWWWTPKGELIDIATGAAEGVEPMKFTPEMLQQAIDLSLKIPSPFMRLDYLVSDDGTMYFDEFCTLSGEDGAIKLERCSKKYDSLYGKLYLQAETNILNDLLAGKRFDEINEFNNRYNERLAK